VLGAKDGNALGDVDGLLLGSSLGVVEGTKDRLGLGDSDGKSVGDIDGVSLSVTLGTAEGAKDIGSLHLPHADGQAS